MASNGLLVAPPPSAKPRSPGDRLSIIRDALGVGNDSGDKVTLSLPFSLNDITAGIENELQVSVAGSSSEVDLPLTIKHSKYLRNMMHRAKAGELSRHRVSDLERFVESNPTGMWENSWVRFPLHRLSPVGQALLHADLLADKRDPLGPMRSDYDQFFFKRNGADWVRVPVSYLLKLALSEAMQATVTTGRSGSCSLGMKALGCFQSDNTSPEVVSFYPCSRVGGRSAGQGIARESARRFLLCSLLIEYANRSFGLRDSGQEVHLYYSPQTPIRQQNLNALVSDSFYRHLFVSPCLSGWDCGEVKKDYMRLCHEVLSRSRMQTMPRLKDAGIIINNIVVLPTVSNTSLANNGTHLTLGSKVLTHALRQESAHYRAEDEKYYGDLVIKIVEHFMPLFVGTYAAAPHRIGFHDFHPELVLGFLPHELDPVHLRMLWRRWKGKAVLKCLGNAMTPFGPVWLDRLIGRTLGLRGDCIPDGRIIDYLVSPLSTDESPALDGQPGNDARLRNDLAEMGIFDQRMSHYLMVKGRSYQTMGFSGFENRVFSLFPSFADVAAAADLMQLLLALAWKYILSGTITHRDIPDSPTIESERRQVFFASAIDVPTFFVHRETGNRMLLRVLERTPGKRPSSRYAGYIRVGCTAYRQALVETLRQDAPDLIALMGAGPLLDDLAERCQPGNNLAAAARLSAGICSQMGVRSALSTRADDFSLAAEDYYRTGLKQQQLAEAWRIVADDLSVMEREGVPEPALRNLANHPEHAAGCPGPGEELPLIINGLLSVMAWDRDRQEVTP